MQNRLDAARGARAASEKQLTELQTAIAAERTARPGTVSFSVLPLPFFFFFLIATESSLTDRLADADADNYAILMIYFTQQHNVEPQDILAYLGVGVDYEELC
jgi:hypothetical protein